MNEDLIKFLPGYCQGLTKVFTTYPFDVIKVKMQTNTYNNTYNCAKDLFKNDRKIFFRGITIPIIVFPIDRAISYRIYENFNSQNLNPYISAFMGGIVSSFFSVPMQYLTTNIINMKKDKYTGLTNYLKSIIKNNNIYRGYMLDTSRAILGSTIFLGSYGNFKLQFPDTPLYTAVSSICSIYLTWIVTFPLDSIRVNQQVTLKETIGNIIIKRYKKYGFFNFYNGLTPVLLRSIPSTTLGMLVYESVKNKINMK